MPVNLEADVLARYVLPGSSGIAVTALNRRRQPPGG